MRWITVYSDFFPVGNGAKQSGTLLPSLFNICMDDLSKKLNRPSIGCSIGNKVVDHMLYADEIVLCAPSAKGLQKLFDVSYAYGCDNDVQCNPLKSVVMYIDSRKADDANDLTIGGDKLNLVTTFKYLGHIISNNLSDEADMKAKVRQMYAKSNMLRPIFHFCSTAVKNK